MTPVQSNHEPTTAVCGPDAEAAPQIVIQRTSLEGFVWPPSTNEPTRDLPRTDADKAGPSRLGALIDSIETTLLGRSSLSFARRAVRDGWERDAYGVYCWRCGGSVGPHETDGEGCGSCRNTKLYWDQAVRLGVYDGAIRDAVLDLKFHRWRTSGNELGQALGLAIRARMDRIGLNSEEIAIVPVPVSWRRRISRGVDHTAVLAKAASGVVGCRCERILRTSHRPEQVGLSMTARGRNIKGAFSIRGGGSRLGDGIRVVALVDDVRTTGATMTAACKGVRAGLAGLEGAEIWVVTAGVSGLGARDRRILKKSGSGGDDF